MPSPPRDRRPVGALRIITRLNVGGPAIQAARLTLMLEERGYHTRLVHGQLGPQEGDMSDLVASHDDVLHVPTLRRPIAPLDDIRAFITLFRELRAFRPEIVHTHMAKAGLLGRLAALAYNATRGRAPRARVVHTYHGHVLEGYFQPAVSRTFIALERWLARASDRLIAISPSIKEELLHTYRIGRDAQYRVVPLGFDLAGLAAIDDHARQEARRALDIPSDAAVVTTVGRLTAIKQPHSFVEALSRLAERHPRLLGVVAGGGELYDELVARTRALGLETRVRWLGWQRNLVTVYGASDVFLLTSRNEGTPVAMIEALAAGVPVVSTDVGGVKDVIGSTGAALLVPFGDASALVAAVDRLLADRQLRVDLGGRGRTRVLEHYGIHRLLDDIDAVYRELRPEA